MESLKNEDFIFQNLGTFKLVHQNVFNSEGTAEDDEPESLDLDYWSNQIYAFIHACKNDHEKEITDILNELSNKLEKREDLIPCYIDSIENSEFYPYIVACLSSKDNDIIYNSIRFISCMVFTSSVFVKSICTNGILNQIIDVYRNQIEPDDSCPSAIIKSFFSFFGYICVDEPAWLFQMVQLGIIPLYDNIILKHGYNLDLTLGILKSLGQMFSYFNDNQSAQSFPYPQVSSLFQTIKILLVSLIIKQEISQDKIKSSDENQKEESPGIIINQNSDIFDGVASGKLGYNFDSIPIEDRLNVAQSCFLILENYENSYITATISLNSAVPQLCYDLINPSFQMIFTDESMKNNIIYHSTLVLRYTFKHAPKILLQSFIEDDQISISLLSYYIEPFSPEIATNVLSVIGHILEISPDTFAEAIECNLFEKVFHLYDKVGFRVKSKIFHVIAAGIINGDSSAIASIFLKSDIIDILIDGIETNISENSDDIPTALNILAHCASEKSEDIYSMILPFIDEADMIINDKL